MADQVVTRIMRSFKFRIRPNKAQEAGLNDMLGAFSDLYNAGLQQRIEAWQRRRVSLQWQDQCGEIKAVRAADERLAKYSFTAEQQVLRQLHKAFTGFFRRVKRGETAGFPRYRAKARFDSATFRIGDGFTLRKTGRIGILGIPGDIKVQWHREIPPDSSGRSVVIGRKAGKWFACFQRELAVSPVACRPFTPVGIDLGLTSLVALSTGETIATPQHTRWASKRQRRLQRALSRCKRDSKRRGKAMARLARHGAKIADQRRDFSHKLSRTIVDRFSHIAMEDLNVKGLASGMLAKAFGNAAWNQLIRNISYKAECAGSLLRLVDPRGTSQTCPECGTIKRKTLAERTHRCHCGCVRDRDVAAAQIVLVRADFGSGTGPQAPSQRIAA